MKDFDAGNWLISYDSLNISVILAISSVKYNIIFGKFLVIVLSNNNVTSLGTHARLQWSHSQVIWIYIFQ